MGGRQAGGGADGGEAVRSAGGSGRAGGPGRGVPAPAAAAAGQAASPPLKYPGGKLRLSKWIQSLAPPHTLRLVACAGGLGEWWSWPAAGVSEVVNDRDGLLVNFYRVLRQAAAFTDFARRAEAVPFARAEWAAARDRVTASRAAGSGPPAAPDVGLALDYFIAMRQSFAGLGGDFAPATTARTRRGMNEQASAWLSAVSGLAAAHARLSRAYVECLDVVDFLDRYARPGAVAYVDPPYLPETVGADDLYAVGMSAAEHARLVGWLAKNRGRAAFLVSGYPSRLYEEMLAGWHRYTRPVRAAVPKAAAKAARVEVVWASRPAPDSEF